MSHREVDALILGGGPAGATAAAVLAGDGHRVTVCERERFPRFHVGESLLPYNVPLFQRIGVWEKLLGHGFQRKFGARFVFEPDQGDVRLDFSKTLDGLPMTLQVRRAEFDEILLRHAEGLGAEVLEEHRVARVLFEGARAVGARVADSGGAEREIRARWVLDATGRDSLLSRQLGIRRRDPDLRQAALYAHYEGPATRSGPEGGDIHVVGGPWGWFWLIPLDARTTSVGVVLPGRVLQERQGDVESFLDELIGRSEFVSEALTEARRITPVHPAADFSYSSTRLTGPGWSLVGDAGGFLDPVFSSGVLLATHCGEAAGRRLGRALRESGPVPASAMRGYERYARRGYRRFRRYVLSYYEPAASSVFASDPPKAIEPAVVSAFAGKVFQNDPRIWIADGMFALTAAQRRWLARRGKLELPQPPASDVRAGSFRRAFT